MIRKRSTKFFLIANVFVLISTQVNSQQSNQAYTEQSPSVAMYFDWISRSWFGSNENKILKNLQFFKWMKDKYGMQLDVYLLDVGTFDYGPNCVAFEGRPAYGNLQSPWFKKDYPNGLNPIYKAATAAGTRLGIWMGPDGYGNSPEEAQQRIDMLAGLCRDYKIKLFKMDLCSSDLRPEKEKYFIEAMQQTRKYSPDLIVLNHRISMSDAARKYTTTFLWEGRETYTDVHIMNDTPGLHHRITNLRRGYPPGLQRLTEDHGVCLSSALDFWEDDLLLQAFNRNLIMSPEIYGDPSFLKDEEFNMLARLYNLHRRYNTIMVNGLELPEVQYGFKAVSRGNAHTRLITLRNLTWKENTITINVDNTIGLGNSKRYSVKLMHPYEEEIGPFKYGEKALIKVLPFRAVLVKVSDIADDLSISGTAYLPMENAGGKTTVVELIGMPGTEKKVNIQSAYEKYYTAIVDGKRYSIGKDDAVVIKFPGKKLSLNYHRKLATLTATRVPSFAYDMYESMCFNNDNNALEVRSLQRAESTKYPAVAASRKSFFEDSSFIKLGLWDKFAFDGDTTTVYKAHASVYSHNNVPPGAMRIGAGSGKTFNRLLLKNIPADYLPQSATASTNGRDWQQVEIKKHGSQLELTGNSNTAYRYVKINPTPLAVSEVIGYDNDKMVSLSNNRLSNLFADSVTAITAYKASFTIKETTNSSYLVLTVPGDYDPEKVFAGILVDGELIPPYDRSPSFLYNNWEHIEKAKGNLSYYFKAGKKLLNKKADIYLFSSVAFPSAMQPELWITAYPIPFEKKQLVLE